MELWPRFPTPLLGSWKKSSLIGSLAVSFTLNIKVKHKSQASVLAKEGRACSSSLGWDLVLPGQELPSLTPPPSGPCLLAASTPRHRFCAAWAGAPFAGPCHHPHTDSTSAKQTNKCHGQGQNPNTQIPNLFLLPNTVL